MLQLLGGAAVVGDLVLRGAVQVERQRLRRLVQLRGPEHVVGVWVRGEHLRAALQVAHLQHVLLEPLGKLRAHRLQLLAKLRHLADGAIRLSASHALRRPRLLHGPRDALDGPVRLVRGVGQALSLELEALLREVAEPVRLRDSLLLVLLSRRDGLGGSSLRL